jgi:hypothetical protein
MNVIHYMGLDVHKKTISYCIKTAAGQGDRVSRRQYNLRFCEHSLHGRGEFCRVPS